MDTFWVTLEIGLNDKIPKCNVYTLNNRRDTEIFFFIYLKVAIVDLTVRLYLKILMRMIYLR